MSKGAAKTESSPAPQPRTPEDIRNVVLVGPGGAGKSTLFDHLVAARVPGRRPQEGERHRSVGLAVASFESNGVTINLIDSPGFPDFVGELRAGLRAADAAIFVISAADDIDGLRRVLTNPDMKDHNDALKMAAGLEQKIVLLPEIVVELSDTRPVPGVYAVLDRFEDEADAALARLDELRDREIPEIDAALRADTGIPIIALEH